MHKRSVSKDLMEHAQKFIEIVKQNYPVERAYLFGDCTEEGVEIDETDNCIAIFMTEVGNHFNDSESIRKLAGGKTVHFLPWVIVTENFPYGYPAKFVKDVEETGVLVYKKRA